MEPLDAAYAAGFFDGEGTVTLSKCTRRGDYSPSYELSVIATQAERPVLDWFAARWGGAVYQHHRGPKWRPLWRWSIYSKRAKRFLEDIAAYSQTKCEHIKLAERWWAEKGERRDYPGRWLSAELIVKREAIVRQFRILNRRGPH